MTIKTSLSVGTLADIKTTLSVGSNTTLKTSLSVGSLADIKTTLSVGSATTLKTSLSVGTLVDIKATLSVGNHVTLKTKLSVGGESIFTSTLSVVYNLVSFEIYKYHFSLKVDNKDDLVCSSGKFSVSGNVILGDWLSLGDSMIVSGNAIYFETARQIGIRNNNGMVQIGSNSRGWSDVAGGTIDNGST